MIIQAYGGGALNLETENDQYFWTREGGKSQTFANKTEAVEAYKNRKIRWNKVEKLTV
jgi:hypothetical protein